MTASSVIERAVASLESLGTTRTEALMYVELLRRGPGTGYDLARRTGIARANTYSALAALLRRDLVERTASTPVSYAAVEPVAVTARLAAGFTESLDQFEHAVLSLADDQPAGLPVLERFDGSAAARAAVERLAARADSTVAVRVPQESLRAFDPMARGLARRGITVDVGPGPNARLGYLLVDREWAAAWRPGGLGLWGNDPLLVTIVAQLLETGARDRG